jgi:hypothetical protein
MSIHWALRYNTPYFKPSTIFQEIGFKSGLMEVVQRKKGGQRFGGFAAGETKFPGQQYFSAGLFKFNGLLDSFQRWAPYYVIINSVCISLSFFCGKYNGLFFLIQIFEVKLHQRKNLGQLQQA